MTGSKILVAAAAGYLSYHMLHTPQGRETAKAALKLALAKSGAAEKALTRILKPNAEPPEEEGKTP